MARERNFGTALSNESAWELAQHFFGMGSSPSQAAVRRELRTRVQAALDQLSPTDQEVFSLNSWRNGNSNNWISQRSMQGVEAWLDAYDEMIDGLTRFVGHGVAPEDASVDFEVQQVVFKTRHGNVYRALYFVEGEDVYVLRVRGKGQAQVRPEDLRRP